MIDPQLELDVYRAYAAYAHRIDDGDLRGWSQLFTDDGIMSVRGKDIVGPEALYQLMVPVRKERARSLFRHLVMNIEVHDASETQAHAVADFLHVGAGTGGAYTEMIGRYNTEFARIDGTWKFHRHAVELLVDKRNPELPLG